MSNRHLRDVRVLSGLVYRAEVDFVPFSCQNNVMAHKPKILHF